MKQTFKTDNWIKWYAQTDGTENFIPLLVFVHPKLEFYVPGFLYGFPVN